ncbi:MAG: 2-C-methyl-D-erythritol 4-phosphate cytidylyltransferase [Candidatus Kapabacteria bacterium]|jgi:2-C-methyl-D-erythritol 4-phosphate cytidylyltransferase|nr:2-C-methyl-D-erythritol 4-phosphate cytidylyltransferase [Candidatus Kapabacteria bacterium]
MSALRTNSVRTTVILPAAGTGTRFGAALPKQFVPLLDVPIIVRTLQIFEQTPAIDAVVIAASPDFHDHITALKEQFHLQKIVAVVEGGKERQDSILNALKTSVCAASDIVLVHDAVRPMITPEFIATIVEAAAIHGAAVPGLVPKETIKECRVEAEGGVTVQTTHERSRLRAIQTPQGFRRELLLAAYHKAHESGFLGTDDASVVEFAGFSVAVVPGLEENIKITTPLDFRWAEWLLRSVATA